MSSPNVPPPSSTRALTKNTTSNSVHPIPKRATTPPQTISTISNATNLTKKASHWGNENDGEYFDESGLLDGDFSQLSLQNDSQSARLSKPNNIPGSDLNKNSTTNTIQGFQRQYRLQQQQKRQENNDMSNNNKTPTPLDSFFLITSFPKPRAYRLLKILLEEIPYYQREIALEPNKKVFQIPAQCQPHTIEIILKLLDHHLIQPYPIVPIPVTPHFIELLHIYDLQVFSTAPQAILLEVAFLAHFWGLRQLYSIIMAYLSLQFGPMTQRQLVQRIREMNGDFDYDPEFALPQLWEVDDASDEDDEENENDENEKIKENERIKENEKIQRNHRRDPTYDPTVPRPLDHFPEPDLQEAVVSALFGGTLD